MKRIIARFKQNFARLFIAFIAGLFLLVTQACSNAVDAKIAPESSKVSVPETVTTPELQETEESVAPAVIEPEETAAPASETVVKEKVEGTPEPAEAVESVVEETEVVEEVVEESELSAEVIEEPEPVAEEAVPAESLTEEKVQTSESPSETSES
jgi:hypothetical protein